MIKCRRGRVNNCFRLLLWLGLQAAAISCVAEEQAVPAEINIGERLFLETRFAQSWYARPGKADPILESTLTTTEPMRGPFAGQTINCRACHMVDEHASDRHGGMRSYADFAHQSLVPQRVDGQYVTPRNSMSLVNISMARENGTVFHFDGEFNSLQDLVLSTLTERNYGWLPNERATAIQHIAAVIRTDDGKGELAQEFGGSYRKILTGIDTEIKTEFRLPVEYRIDVARASDTEIILAVGKLISAYVGDLSFKKDDSGNYSGSPYDHFLMKNSLPRRPGKGESALAYSQRLAKAIGKIQNPAFISSQAVSFTSHKQEFSFGKKEFTGMKLFFRKANNNIRGGNCVACHAAPDFSDFSFHNTGLSQITYDELHGPGKFNTLVIPDLQVRNQNHDVFLPATAKHPKASGRFRSLTDQDKPGLTDLGLWNIFANPDMPAPQEKLKRLMCIQLKNTIKNCHEEMMLPFTVAAFKTPVIRDLGHSAPYMHNGKFTNLKEAIGFYVNSSALAKAGQLRNAAPELEEINLAPEDIDSLVAFVKSLNEDYE